MSWILFLTTVIDSPFADKLAEHGTLGLVVMLSLYLNKIQYSDNLALRNKLEALLGQRVTDTQVMADKLEKVNNTALTALSTNSNVMEAQGEALNETRRVLTDLVTELRTRLPPRR